MCWYKVLWWSLFGLAIGKCWVVVGEFVKLGLCQLVVWDGVATDTKLRFLLEGISISVT